MKVRLLGRLYVEINTGESEVMTLTMVRGSQKANMTEKEVEGRVRAHPEIERDTQRKETYEKLQNKKLECLHRLGGCSNNFNMKFQVMQSSYQAQIANLQNNTNEFNSFQNLHSSLVQFNRLIWLIMVDYINE